MRKEEKKQKVFTSLDTKCTRYVVVPTVAVGVIVAPLSNRRLRPIVIAAEH